MTSPAHYWIWICFGQVKQSIAGEKRMLLLEPATVRLYLNGWATLACRTIHWPTGANLGLNPSSPSLEDDFFSFCLGDSHAG